MSRATRSLVVAVLAVLAAHQVEGQTPTPTERWYLNWSTYLGGQTPAPTRTNRPAGASSAEDTVRGSAIDSQGNIYVAGTAGAMDFPTTGGQAHSNDGDAFVAKFAPTGELLWSQIYGGPNHDRAYGVAVHPSNDNEVIWCGRGGPGFPTTRGVLQERFGGDTSSGGDITTYGPQDGVVCKLNAANGNVIWCSYFGNTSQDLIRDCKFDRDGDIYLAYNATEGGSPSMATAGAFRTSGCGATVDEHDPGVAKISNNGTRLYWMTYVCGNANEDPPSLAVRLTDEAVYFVTSTSSTNWPINTAGVQTWVNAFDTTLSGPHDYGIVVVAPNGASLLFSTLYGGNGPDLSDTHTVAVSPIANELILCGATGSSDLPGVTGASYQTTLQGSEDNFVARIRVTAPTSVLMASYHGGSGREFGAPCSVDEDGDPSFASSSRSADYPTTYDAPQSTFGGGFEDAVVVKFNRDLSSRRYATYMGGVGIDSGRASSARNDALVLGGQSDGTDYPVRNCVQCARAGNTGDAVISRFSLIDQPTWTPTGNAQPTPTPNGGGPLAVPNLVLWLDAARLSLSEGARVASWADASGHGHAATQDAVANQPTYRTNVLNGKPVVRFDGTDFMNIAGTLVTGAQARTVFFVARPDVAGNKGIIDLGNGATARAGFLVTPEYGVRINTGSRLWPPAASTTAAVVGVVRFNGTTTNDLTAWSNGSQRTAGSTVVAAVETAGHGTVGAWTAAPLSTTTFDGDIAEIVVYNRALLDAERQLLEHYLAGKFAITLPGGGATPTPSATVAAPLGTQTPTRTLAPTITATRTATPTAIPNDGGPLAVPNLVLWLDAARLSLSEGARVASWADASGHGHAATQDAVANQPTYRTNVLNGKPVVRFDGTDFMNIAGTLVTGAQARTVFFVARPDVAGNKGIIDLGNGATARAGFLVTPEYGVRINTGNRLWPPAASTTAAAVGVVQFNGTTTNDLTAWSNGSQRTAGSTVVAAVETAGHGTVGAWTAAPLSPTTFDGDIAEIVVYNRALTASERLLVQEYLAQKYGLP